MIDIRKKVKQVWFQSGGSEAENGMTISEEKLHEFVDAIIRGDAFIPPIQDIQKMKASEVEHYIHNATAGRAILAISRPTFATTGNAASVMAILEGVVAGTILAATKLGGHDVVLDVGHDVVLDVFLEGVRRRLNTMPANSP